MEELGTDGTEFDMTEEELLVAVGDEVQIWVWSWESWRNEGSLVLVME